ncbi:MAG: NAD-dependent epimerase/dehydratase family protein [Candidatus Ratteibacteria bacterium]|jgi:nucleoside-diphosphate-sugar epimerase
MGTKSSGNIKTILVTGGAGYVGSVLVPVLLKQGYKVKVIDLYIYGEHVLDSVKDNRNLEQIKGDIRNQNLLKEVVAGCDAVIHLACISNDPSVELDPFLSQSINYDAFGPLVQISKDAGIQRFILASSGSVYGISGDADVTEDHPLVPVSLYNKYKAMCEPVLLESSSSNFVPVIIRPATICGCSPRQRLDLTVNILTNHAVNSGCITVFGGSQMRPNLHMRDMVDLYAKLLEFPDFMIAGKVYNVVCQNYTVAETAEIVRNVVAEEMPEKEDIEIVTTPSDDIRSYHISGKKIERELGFTPRCTVEDGARDLIKAFRNGKLPDSLTDIRYYNIKMMKDIKLK